ncbi:MAG: membrane protein [Lysobacteraceae bacterium]|nr:MAG: membrane protein [Xanthomonadaceae bacterium]
MIAMVALTFTVWIRMYYVRIGEMRRRRIHPQSVDTSRSKGVLEDVAAADNLKNLFEIPVLFYVACLTAIVAGAVTPLIQGLAWSFVGLRVAHSLIHISYNRVMHRFIVYVLGALCAFAMWGLLAVEIAL